MIYSDSNSELNVLPNTASPDTTAFHDYRPLPLQLSFELWAMIIKYAESETQDFAQRFNHLRNYASICRQLLEVVRGAPELWSLVFNPPNQLLAQIAFKRSRQHPLIVVHTKELIPLKIMGEILPQIPRTKVLKVKAGFRHAKSLLNKIMEEDAGRMLEQLSITDTSSNTLCHVPQLALQATKLREVRFTGIHTPLDNIQLPPSLTKLTLELHPHESTNIAPYFRFLSVLPNIVDLRFDVNKQLLQTVAWPVNQEISPIVLPRLRKLELYDLPGQTTAALLHSIESQCCEKVVVRVEGVAAVEGLRVSLFTRQTAVSRVITAPTFIEISKNSASTLNVEVVCGAEQENPRTTLFVRIESHRGHPEFACSLLTDIQHYQLHTLKITGLKLAQWVANCLPNCLNLKNLYLGNFADSDLVITALGEGHGFQNWICPNLTSLELRGITWYGQLTLLDMIRYRYSLQVQQQSIPPAPTPVPLDNLTISLYYQKQAKGLLLEEKDMEEIKQIVGVDSCRFIRDK
ncbi:hypothetical protein FRC02_011810 [Tulasnella sp. 418]|nr:hypothetical protein FRC02_011810 [Tulasnella sp. 418]